MTITTAPDIKPATKRASASRLAAKDPTLAAPSRLKLQIFGPPGVGKTWGTLEFPACYYIDTEGGANLPHYVARMKASGGAYLGPEDGALDFDFILAQCAALASEQHGYKTLVIDSVTKIFNLAVSAEAERLGDKNAFGADKKKAVSYMRRLISWINRLDMNVVLIAHEKAAWGDVNGQRAEIGKAADSWDKVEYELNLNLQIARRGGARVAIVRKSRLEGFPENESVPWSFAEFANRYGGAGLGADAKVNALATPDQVQQINALLSVLKVSEEDLDKWLAKAGAETVGELETAKAVKLADFLRAKIQPATLNPQN